MVRRGLNAKSSRACVIAIVLCVIAVSMACGTGNRQTSEAMSTSRLQRLLDSDVSDAVRKWHPPGISVAVMLRDGRVVSAVRGVESFDGRTPVTATSAFAAGSVTKTFVAATVLRLVEERRLRLDDSIRRWLPDVPAADKITVRQLLSHTSGLAWDHGTWEGWFRDIVDKPDSPVPAHDQLRPPPRLAKTPGSVFRYENWNYELLARIIESITGQGLSAAIRSRFLDPLKLRRTFVQPDERPQAPIADGYALRVNGRFADDFVDTLHGPATQSDYVDVSRGGKGYLPSLRMASLLPASGGMASTPSDLARWASALWGGQVLDRSSTGAMLTVSKPSTEKHDPPGFDGYGLGVVRFLTDGQVFWCHGGGLTGFQSLAGYLPHDQVSIAVTVNTSRDALIVGDLVQAILRSVGVDASKPIVC